MTTARERLEIGLEEGGGALTCQVNLSRGITKEEKSLPVGVFYSLHEGEMIVGELPEPK